MHCAGTYFATVRTIAAMGVMKAKIVVLVLLQPSSSALNSSATVSVEDIHLYIVNALGTDLYKIQTPARIKVDLTNLPIKARSTAPILLTNILLNALNVKKTNFDVTHIN